MTASANIPDGFSMGELELLAEAAAERETDDYTEAPEEALYDGKTKSEVCDIVDNILGQSLKECNDPMVHKILALEIISNMIEWHTTAGIELFQEGETEAAVAWTRDAGKLSLIHI